MHVIAVVLAVVMASVIAALLFKPFFGDRDEFFRYLKFWLTPNIVSMFRGEYWKDWLSEAKLGFWFAAAGLSAFVTYAGLMKLFG
jgi:hypothetical protein